MKFTYCFVYKNDVANTYKSWESKKRDLNKEILRIGMIAELDAVNLYEQMAAITENKNIKKIF